jgi:hypothetical protein
VVFEQEVQVRTGSSCSIFRGAGTATYFLAEFSKDAMKVGGTRLSRERDIDKDLLLELERKLTDAIHK